MKHLLIILIFLCFSNAAVIPATQDSANHIFIAAAATKLIDALSQDDNFGL